MRTIRKLQADIHELEALTRRVVPSSTCVNTESGLEQEWLEKLLQSSLDWRRERLRDLETQLRVSLAMRQLRREEHKPRAACPAGEENGVP